MLHKIRAEGHSIKGEGQRSGTSSVGRQGRDDPRARRTPPGAARGLDSSRVAVTARLQRKRERV